MKVKHIGIQLAKHFLHCNDIFTDVICFVNHKVEAADILHVSTETVKSNLKNKQLQEIPAEIQRLQHLTNLNLEDNAIQVIPRWIGQLKNLRVLYLNNNSIKDFGPLTDIANLEVLHLNDNQIEVIPASISQLSGLKRLFLNNNSITVLPPEIGALANMTYPLLAGNKLRQSDILSICL